MNNGNKKIYEFGTFRLNSAEHALSLDGENVSLTPKVIETHWIPGNIGIGEK